MKKKPIGEYYADYDEETGLWCVFNTDDVGDKKAGFAFASCSGKSQAEENAKQRNEQRK